MNIDQLIIKKYQAYDEDLRLKKDKAHQLEFITTTHFIDLYLKPKSKILEIGAGTGAYSIHYAKRGYSVDAVELVKSNLDRLNEKIESSMDIRSYMGNALDLSFLSDNTFDITLCLGPLYHLFCEEDMKKAIAECIRVTKPHGIIFFAYIPSDTVMINWLLRKHRLLDYQRFYDNNFQIKQMPEECFSTWKMASFEKFLQDYPIHNLNNVGVSGLSIILSDYVNPLTDEEFSVWTDYHLKTCTDRETLGYNNEIICICEKENLE